jgi:predicted ATPase
LTIERIVFIGGPGTGKTTLINALAARGYNVFEEISRQVTKAAQEEGVSQLFLTEPLLFSQKLLEGRVNQFNAAAENSKNLVLYDRGIPDVLAYMDYAGQTYPQSFVEACKKHRYDRVFMLPPWEEIHEEDNERYEDFATATALHDFLVKTYTYYGYAPINVPRCPVAQRIDFIETQLKR